MTELYIIYIGRRAALYVYLPRLSFLLALEADDLDHLLGRLDLQQTKGKAAKREG